RTDVLFRVPADILQHAPRKATETDDLRTQTSPYVIVFEQLVFLLKRHLFGNDVKNRLPERRFFQFAFDLFDDIAARQITVATRNDFYRHRLPPFSGAYTT